MGFWILICVIDKTGASLLRMGYSIKHTLIMSRDYSNCTGCMHDKVHDRCSSCSII